jgi:hypothetical protein
MLSYMQIVKPLIAVPGSKAIRSIGSVECVRLSRGTEMANGLLKWVQLAL